MKQLSDELRSELYAQESTDPFLMLVTLNHDTFDGPVRLVSNTEDIESRGETYTAFPIEITLPADDGETTKRVTMVLDNVSLALIEELRSVITPIKVDVETILASMPDVVQTMVGGLSLQNIQYDKTRITAQLFFDDFLNTEMIGERYVQSKYPGLF